MDQVRLDAQPEGMVQLLRGARDFNSQTRDWAFILRADRAMGDVIHDLELLRNNVQSEKEALKVLRNKVVMLKKKLLAGDFDDIIDVCDSMIDEFDELLRISENSHENP